MIQGVLDDRVSQKVCFTTRKSINAKLTDIIGARMTRWIEREMQANRLPGNERREYWCGRSLPRF